MSLARKCGVQYIWKMGSGLRSKWESKKINIHLLIGAVTYSQWEGYTGPQLESHSLFLPQEGQSSHWFCSLVGPINHITHPHICKYAFPQPGCRSLCAHSSTFPVPPWPTHQLHRGRYGQDHSGLSVSPISVPYFWQMMTTSGPLGELPMASWHCLLVPCHLVFNFRLALKFLL